MMPQWLANFLKWVFGSTQVTPPKPPAPPAPEPPVEPEPPVVVEEPLRTLASATINGYPQGAALEGCDNDGKNLAEYLAPKGFTVLRLREQNVTGPGLEAFWRQAVRDTRPGDQTVLHFSGHGSNGPSGLPEDPGQNIVTVELRPFYASRIGRILAEELQPGAEVLVLLDCCHSEHGTRVMATSRAMRSVKTVPWSMLNTSEDPIPTTREHRAYSLAALARSDDFGVIEFAACQANDVTWDARIFNPVTNQSEIQGCATRAWIDAASILDRDKPNGYTVREFQNQVRMLLPNSQFPNQPQVWASDAQLDKLMWR